MKMCRLEEVECEFSGVGCEERFRREDQEEHTRQNSQKHLTLTASLAKQLQQELEEQDKKHREEELMLKKKMEVQDKKIKEQEKKMEEQEKKMEEQDKVVEELKKVLKEEQDQKLKEQEEMEKKFSHKFQELQKMFKELRVTSDQNEAKHNDLTRKLQIQQRTFEIKNYSTEIKRGWTSPAMYTHTGGYKFCARVYVSLRGALCVNILSLPGEFDSLLQWPVKVKFTMELIHQQRGRNICATDKITLNRSTHEFKSPYFALVETSRLDNFLVNDTLYFCISNIELL